MSENGFELLYCEHGSSYHSGPMNARGDFNENIYPLPSLKPPESKPARQTLVNNSTGERGSSLNKAYENEANQKRELEIKINQSLRGLRRPAPGLSGTKSTQNKSQIAEDGESDERVCTEPAESNNAGDKPSTNTQAKPNIENIYNLVKGMMEGTATASFDQFVVPISVILSQLVNWELLSDKEISLACKALKLVAESKINGILAMPANVTQMINLLYSQDIPIDIQITTV